MALFEELETGDLVRRTGASGDDVFVVTGKVKSKKSCYIAKVDPHADFAAMAEEELVLATELEIVAAE